MTGLVISITITQDNAGQRLDSFLGHRENITSRSQASLLIKAGHIKVNGHLQKPSYLLEKGDQLYLQMPPEKPSTLVPWNYPLDIIHEDQDLIVLNKPSGLVVHPAAGHDQDTLVNALIAHTDELSMGLKEKRPGIVHRLDKDTSGLLVVAKNNHSHNLLAQQFKDKTTHRVYHAICFGKFKSLNDSIEGFISRHPNHRKKFSLNNDKDKGKWSKTHYKVLMTTPSGLNLVELKLETGRTHQIRVHLSHIGHPVVGDDLYGALGYYKNLKSENLKKKIKDLGRFALHAKELGFKHPSSKKDFFFSTDMPDILKNLCS